MKKKSPPKTYNEEMTAFSRMLLGKLDICLQKTETKFIFVTLYKYQLKVD
jgi:hypothetical protein